MTIKKLKKLEAVAYPEYMRQLQECWSMEDLADYCECSVDQVSLKTGRGWYMIVADHGSYVEFVDFVATEGREASATMALVAFLRKLKGRRVALDARKSTSYPLILRLIPRLGATIVSEEEWRWSNEEMVEMVIDC